MISRKTASTLADSIANKFFQHISGSRFSKYRVDTEHLYDFLYEHNYEAWFCNLASSMDDSGETRTAGTRKLKEFVMKLHTGESLVSGTLQWTWEQRASLGQQYIHNLAQDMLANAKTDSEEEQELRRALEIDGYIFVKGKLLAPEAEVLNVVEEVGLLQSLYNSLSLANSETAFHHLALSEDHYKSGRWDDSISNSRKFLESVLQEVATSYSLVTTKRPISPDVYSKPVLVRKYLTDNGLLDTKEKEAVASIYGLLSEKGSHPYMAHNDQARLLRNLALTISQFVMLRLRGSISQLPEYPPS